MRPRNEEEERILRDARILPPLNLWEMGVEVDEMESEVIDYVCYNSSYYYDGKWQDASWDTLTYHAVLQEIHEYQVVRICGLNTKMRSPRAFCRSKGGEIAQLWYNKDGKLVAYLARRAHNNHYTWCYNDAIVLRRKPYGFDDIETFKVASISESAFRIDWASLVHDRGPYFYTNSSDKSMLPILSSPFGEYLFKCEPALFDYLTEDPTQFSELEDCETAIKIAHRHKYDFGSIDIATWCDHIKILKELGKDLHSPHYVCPINLEEAHKFYNKLYAKNKAKMEMEKKKKESQAQEQSYAERMGKYLGICISTDNLVIKPLQSVQEFVEEGTAMHHCVYGCGYYKKADTLILSAKDLEGNRVETIEINLKTYKVAQSRAVCNGVSKYHDEIISTLNGQMNIIKAIKETPKATKRARRATSTTTTMRAVN